jgi:archaemetzincin
MDFKPPGEKERLAAIGFTGDLPAAVRRALEPRDDFEPVPAPRAGDWLAEHREEGQSYDDFIAARRNVPRAPRTKLCFQPLGEFPKDRSPSLDLLKEYAAASFLLPVEVLPALPLDEKSFTPRTNSNTGRRQILAPDVLKFLRQKLPADAFCVLAVTMEDLYPEPSWNFVFGSASLGGRTGVYSFARYDPVFYGQARGADYEKLLLKRSVRVLEHETAHMFGLKHCIHFQCLMNGSNHLQESDSRPLRLCPVCLRKLQACVPDFSPVKHYRALLAFHRKVGFDDEAAWIDKRLRWIEEGK